MFFQGKNNGMLIVDRGDPSVRDFIEVEFSKVPTWHELDLSGIVPVGAVGVFVRIECVGTTLAKTAQFKNLDNINNPSMVYIQIDTIDFLYERNVLIFCDSEAKIQYRLSGDFFTTLSLTVCGWII